MSRRSEKRIWEFDGNFRFKRGSLTMSCKVLIMPQRNCKVDESKILVMKFVCKAVDKVTLIASAF